MVIGPYKSVSKYHSDWLIRFHRLKYPIPPNLMLYNAFHWAGHLPIVPHTLGGGCGSPSNSWLLGGKFDAHEPAPPHQLNCSLSVFAGLTGVTNSPTHRPRYSIWSNRSHLCDTPDTAQWKTCKCPDAVLELANNLKLLFIMTIRHAL